MDKNKEKILTSKIVKELCLDRVSVITADILKGYTKIGDHAFESCSNLASIDIPNSVTNIGRGAFYGCHSLTSVIIPTSVTNIGDDVFEYCSSLTSVTIPNSIISIGYEAFMGCSSLISIDIPNSVTSIGSWAFSCCSSLTSVTIPDSVTVIGYGAFYDCNSLTSVIIPDSVTHIDKFSFYACCFKHENKTDKQGRIIAYKGFNADMTCLDFQYKEGETYKIEYTPVLCKYGFHACLNPLDCLNYYSGQIGKDVVFHEVYLEGVPAEKYDDSKVVAKKITIGREITLSEMADIASGRK